MAGNVRKMDSEHNVDVHSTSSILQTNAILGEERVFKQDKAAVHSSNRTKFTLKANNIEILNWPAKSYHLNNIENL